MEPEKKPSAQPSPPPLTPGAAYALVGQIGYMIAVPAVLFGFGGAYLDKYVGSSPAFLLSGLFFAFASSGWAIWRMIKRMMP